jgi:Uncharacterized conserved protein
MDTDKNCDFSPLKQELQAQLTSIAHRLDRVMADLDENDTCLLNELDEISKSFMLSSALASSYYLKCFLSPFTDKYDEISQSILRIRLKRLGALIVIERDVPVADLISPGIPLSAEITSSLLESIFVTGSPLHDGAVLIKGDKIVSAANILPLTKKRFSGRKLGTRHRAAIGLSERSDALVLVVSEETGTTSFSLDGRLYPFSIPAPSEGSEFNETAAGSAAAKR